MALLRGRMDDNFVMDIYCDMSKFKFESKNPLITVADGNILVREATKKGYEE